MQRFRQSVDNLVGVVVMLTVAVIQFRTMMKETFCTHKKLDRYENLEPNWTETKSNQNTQQI